MGLDSLGYRKLLGVLAPSTNTTVQPDYDDMRVHGVTNHYSRIFTPNAKAISDDSFYQATLTISKGVMDAVHSVMTCEPDHLVMGMSAVSFYGGAKGADEFQRAIEKESGIGITIGPHACTAALKAYGGIRRIAFLSPYYPVANTAVRQYFADMGFETVRDVPLRAPSWTGIAQIPESRLRAVIKELDGPDVDAILQVGTNLSMVRLAAAAERFLGKPVIAINTATYWQALRTCGITDKVYDLGRLLSDF